MHALRSGGLRRPWAWLPILFLPVVALALFAACGGLRRSGPAAIATAGAAGAVTTRPTAAAGGRVALAPPVRGAASGRAGGEAIVRRGALAGLDVQAMAFLPGGEGFLVAWRGGGCYGGTGGCVSTVLRRDAPGGAWRPVYRAPGLVHALSFPNHRDGFALGGSCNPAAPAAGCSANVLRTTDGGTSWRVVYRRTGQLLQQLAFVDARHGWLRAADGRLLRTTDGGRTWSPLPVPCPAGQSPGPLAFASPSSGLLVCQAPADGPTVAKTLFSSADGGSAWTPVPAALPASGSAASLALTASGLGWLCTLPVGGPLWVTRDGGRSWRQAAPSLQGADLLGVTVPSGHSSALYALLGLGPRAAVLRSADGGAHWTGVYPAAGPFLGTVGGAPPVEFVSPSEGYAVGLPWAPAAVLRTQDGGATWRPAGHLPAGGILDWSFTTAGRGWAILARHAGRAQVLATTDGGGSWRPVRPSWAGSPRWVLRSARGGGWLLAGDTLYRSRGGTGGFTPVGRARGAQGLSRPSGRALWGLFAGVVRHSGDGGAHWSGSGAPPAHAEALSLSFPDAAHGWVLTAASCPRGCPEVLWVTGDGGRAWRPLPLGALQARFIDFVDARQGYLVTATGALLQTVDGGRSWAEAG